MTDPVVCPTCLYETRRHVPGETLECPRCEDRLYPHDAVDLIAEDRQRRTANVPWVEEDFTIQVDRDAKGDFLMSATLKTVISGDQVIYSADGVEFADNDGDDIRTFRGQVVRELERAFNDANQPSGGFAGP
jgi:hypothetical protein